MHHHGNPADILAFAKTIAKTVLQPNRRALSPPISAALGASHGATDLPTVKTAAYITANCSSVEESDMQTIPQAIVGPVLQAVA